LSLSYWEIRSRSQGVSENKKGTEMNTNKPKPKRGRPTIGSRAMTPAQRQQRYRARIKKEAYNLLAEIGKIEPKNS